MVTKQIDISGVVQGVGFRPFLFRMAHGHKLNGEVFNTAHGVTLILEGIEKKIEKFLKEMILRKPPLSTIFDIKETSIGFSGYKGFVITLTPEDSEKSSSKSALISPDVSICSDCLKEMNNPDDRRFAYPFINCTNCGPRYTIIKDIPYDRAKTSMNLFPMCQRCQEEYDDPMDRRFHAQPNACHECGPHVFFMESSSVSKTSSGSHGERAIDDAAKLLTEGKILALKGLGGFHLAVDALNPEAVATLRLRKKRPHKPFALMVKSVETASRLVQISSEDKTILESHARPILLLRKNVVQAQNHCYQQPCQLQHFPCQTQSLHSSLDMCQNTPFEYIDFGQTFYEKIISAQQEIAPDNAYIGIMLPYTPLHALLLDKSPSILVMTSGNRSGEPLSIDNQDALDAFSHIADGFLLHNRDIYFRADDSIMQRQCGQSRFIRRSRGYAPLPIYLKTPVLKPVLACGGGLKSTICLAEGERAFLSPHIGDLDNEKVFAFYRKSIVHLKQILDIEPEIIIHDLHPGYMSTKFAKNYYEYIQQENKVRIAAVQHHHAHALSCMAENGLEGEVIAVTLDGTGLGTDRHIWGGEVLLCSRGGFQRKAHLAYLPMPGGDAAVHEPWRMAISYLYAAFGDDLFFLEIPFLQKVDNNKIKFIIQMIKKKLNTPLTSSCGRLFDAVASLLLLCQKVSFEGQAAMALESHSATINEKLYPSYPFEIIDSNSHLSPCSRNSFNHGKSEGAFQEKVLHDNKNHDAVANHNMLSESFGMMFQINTLPLVKAIIMDILEGKPRYQIATRFHMTIIDLFVASVLRIRHETGVNKVVLSGGVFHNTFILSGMVGFLEKEKMRVYTHKKVPCGDGGIALGQIIAADALVNQ
ncbi:(NiFe) hydrogenase maturation protein HypF [Desulfamplus magnetovallimortis]|uniref:acylphosphatase n=1 Tax=Desulfamplus magnetovallimortis TaxID=1246637 RepID=A0A1W1HCL1_9BACT|nr:carbamoyltransferase HypF [Desulfamplus magnetovallimortis]SLM30173.1 (NiFe) hydrogenase maturation protein HypF [Desulfamplus magnetovallimortis]